jgi:small GTP-binding protein
MIEAPPKVVLIGSINVGKTSLFNCFQGTSIHTTYVPTIRGCSAMVEAGSAHFIVWDTAGSERYRATVPLYFKDVCVVIAVYDVTCLKSFEDIRDWVVLVRKHCPPEVTIMLVGNKADLEHVITDVQAEAFSTELEIHFAGEVSAKTYQGVTNLLHDVGEAILAPVVTTTRVDLVKVDTEQPQKENCKC